MAKAPSEREREPYAFDRSQHPGSLDVQLTRRIGARASPLAVEPDLASAMIRFAPFAACQALEVWFTPPVRSTV